MKKTALHLLLLFTYLNGFAEYSILKLENDFCNTASHEGEVQIFATGNSGPYVIKNVLGNLIGSIGTRQVSSVISNLKWGTHTFTVENSIGCSIDLTIEILKVNCGNCPSNSNHDVDDYIYTGSSTISGISSIDLQKLKTYFSSNFTVDSDIPKGMICVKDQCLFSNTMGVGYIAYGNLLELNKRLKNISHSITVELEDQWGNLINGSYSNANGRMMFNSLQSGTYTLNVLLTTGRGTQVISTRTVMVNQINCGPGSSKLVAVSNGNNSSQQNEITKQTNVELYKKSVKNNIDTANAFWVDGISLDAYPNPFWDKLTIKVSSSESLDNGKLVLLNAAGQEISQIFNNTISSSTIITIDLSTMLPDIFHLL